MDVTRRSVIRTSRIETVSIFGMGRASLGIRKQIGWRTSPERVERIDRSRGRMSRDTWLDKAVDYALRNTPEPPPPPEPVIEEPPAPTDHECKFALLKGTKFAAGKKYRVYGCTCGNTREVPA